MRPGGREPLAELKSATVVAERHTNALRQREDGAGYRDAITLALSLAGRFGPSGELRGIGEIRMPGGGAPASITQ